MKVSYSKGVATHADPESCVRTGNRAGEALTGARAGRVLSRESKINFGGPTPSWVRKATWIRSLSQELLRPRVVLDPVHVRKLFTREPGDPASDLGDGPRNVTSLSVGRELLALPVVVNGELGICMLRQHWKRVP